ncbi:Calreticulin family protein [Aphelenchoides besseyi]|nr:Calreticulin family protein [Aphelenchoides besseyi]KAI6201177.1 Calreticulin family protein [Aphelenchoides besseyi]
MFRQQFLCFFLLIFPLVVVSDDESDTPSTEEFQPRTFEAPALDLSNVFFVDLFNDRTSIGQSWKTSTAKKEGLEESLAKYNGVWSIGSPSKVVLHNDFGLIAESKARHHAIAVALSNPIEFKSDELVVQYEVKYEEGQECGGGYIKLLNEGAEKIQSFADKTEYSIMFGPDKCGAQSKVHFIIKLKNPHNGTISEHHAPQPKSIPEFADRKTHLFTLKMKRNNNYEVLLDNKSLYYGNMLTDLVPSVTPPKQIADPEDKKPSDWDENEYIVDPEAKKPDDWDEDQPKEIVDEDAVQPSDWLIDEEPLIPDPEAQRPEDWDDSMDGTYEPRLIANPECQGRSGCGVWKKPMKANPLYKGKWTAPKIKNPNYKGKWSAQLIENPNYYEADPYNQLKPVTALGFELWTMSPNIIFDNIFIDDNSELAADFAAQTFNVKKQLEDMLEAIESPSTNFFQGLINATEERPWLWAVYILCVLLPIIAISAYFFGRKSTPTYTDSAKKTDAYQPDDEEKEDSGANAEEVAEEIVETTVEEKTTKPRNRRSSSRRQSTAADGELTADS